MAQVTTNILRVCRETMIDASRHDHEIVLLQLDPHPVIALAAYIEEASAVQDIADLLVLVQVLIEEHLYLLFIDITHCLRRDCHLIPILILAL